MTWLRRIFRRPCRCPDCRLARLLCEMDARAVANAAVMTGAALAALNPQVHLVVSAGRLPDGQRIAVMVGVGTNADEIVAAARETIVQAASVN